MYFCISSVLCAQNIFVIGKKQIPSEEMFTWVIQSNRNVMWATNLLEISHAKKGKAKKINILW